MILAAICVGLIVPQKLLIKLIVAVGLPEATTVPLVKSSEVNVDRRSAVDRELGGEGHVLEVVGRAGSQVQLVDAEGAVAGDELAAGIDRDLVEE